MERPNWLECYKCLFYEGDACFFERIPRVKSSNDFCDEWRCKNCWSTWYDWHYDDDKENEFFIDHNHCKRKEMK